MRGCLLLQLERIGSRGQGPRQLAEFLVRDHLRDASGARAGVSVMPFASVRRNPAPRKKQTPPA
ncbi:MAG: hypothetical protein ACM3XS_02420 [Bacteroidota bacterium]